MRQSIRCLGDHVGLASYRPARFPPAHPLEARHLPCMQPQAKRPANAGRSPFDAAAAMRPMRRANLATYASAGWRDTGWAMSQDNVEIVRRVYERWGIGDFRAGTELYDPWVVFVLRKEFPDAGAYLAPEGIRKYMLGFLEGWDHAVIEGEEFIAAGDSVVVRVHQQAAGKQSGTPVDMRYFQVWTFRGGTVIRIESVRGREEALDAAGLEDQLMAKENVEIVRRAYEAFAQGDLEKVLQAFHPEVEIRPDPAVPDLGGFHGREGWLALAAQWFEPWEEYRIEPEEFIEAGHQVVILTREFGRGKDTGYEVEQRIGTVWTFRDGEAVRLEFFLDQAEALKAAGL